MFAGTAYSEVRKIYDIVLSVLHSAEPLQKAPHVNAKTKGRVCSVSSLRAQNLRDGDGDYK